MTQTARSRKTSPITTTLLAGAAGLITAAAIAIAGLAFTSHESSATPALAKGRACGVCHTGSPPTKKNLKPGHPK